MNLLDENIFEPQRRQLEDCLVYLEVNPDETARFIRRFLRHRMFRTQAQRMGNVVRVHEDGINFWRLGAGAAQETSW